MFSLKIFFYVHIYMQRFLAMGEVLHMILYFFIVHDKWYICKLNAYQIRQKKKNIFRQFSQFVRFYNRNYEFFNFKIRKMFWFYICYYVVLRTKIRKWIWIKSFYFEKKITLIPKRNYSTIFKQNIRKINIQKFLGFLAFFLPKKRTCQLNAQILW